MIKVDVVIVGGGMVGLTLAAALQDSNMQVALISKEPLTAKVPEAPLLRVSAINEANREALERLNVWAQLPQDRLSAYTHMHVWDQDSFGQIHFDSQDLGTSQLGHIIENQVLTNALAAQVSQQSNCLLIEAGIDKMLCGEQETMLMLDNDEVLSCRLVVGADGAGSFVRKQAGFPLTFRDYGQTAMVATIKTAQPHQQTARQVFTPHGPLALLPLHDPHLCSIVWSQETAQAEYLHSLSDTDFAHALTKACSSVLGVAEVVSERKDFVLTMRYARQWVGDGVAIIGDAAHTLHPLAGQGANLGIQDALVLADTLRELHDADKPLGRQRYLRRFERARKTEAVQMIGAMDGFKTLFGGSNPVKKLIRGLGLVTTDQLPNIKRELIQRAMGF